MRILIPVVFGLFAACGPSPKTGGNSEQKNDSTMNAMAPAGENVLTDAEKSEGWQLLFDGTSKAGWHNYLNKTDGSNWKTDNGTLYLDTTLTRDGQPFGGDLVTDEEYDNFHFKTDWKINTAGNSGVLFYVKEEPQFVQTYRTGPEMQVLDNNGHPDAKIFKHRAGDLYDLIASSPETVKPAGEWNTAEIISKDGALEFILNGTSVLKTTLWDENWRKLIAESKFKEWPEFGTYKKGRLALQDHKSLVWYKNIKIRKL